MTDQTSNKPSPVAPNGEQVIHGLVADILNEREVVLNVGQRNDVTLDMRFAILEDIKYEVKDPETGEILGLVPPRSKVRVEVVHVQEKMCVARTYEITTRNVGGGGLIGLGLGSIMDPPRYVDEPITFRIGEGTTYFRKISPAESIVKVGDRVVQIKRK